MGEARELSQGVDRMRMYVTFAFIFLVAAMPLNASAEGGVLHRPSQTNIEADELSVGTTIRCEGEESVGFNWRDGRWQPTRFELSTFIFKKLDHTDDTNDMCRNRLANKLDSLTSDSNTMILKRCYSVQRLGSGRGPWAEGCAEWHFDGEIHSIRCGTNDAYTFHPNEGLIVLPRLRNVEINPDDDYKDSLSIQVGQCGEI